MMWIRRSIIGFAVVALIALLASVSLSGSAKAQTKSWEFERWQSVMAVQENGDILVKETHTIRFTGSFSFYGRTIPHRRLDNIVVDRVVDETAGRELLSAEYDVSNVFFEGYPATDIEIHFSLADTVQTWSLYYVVKGGVGFFEDHDELYWNVISSDRDVPIQSIEAVVQLPQEVDPEQIETTHFEDGVRDVVEEVVDGKTVRFATGRAAPATDFTIVVGWPTGIVQNPGIVRIESSPSGADIIVDGVDTFLEAPSGLRRGHELVGTGPWTVRVAKYGITSKPYQVTVEPGQTQAVAISVFDTFGKKLLVGLVVGAVSAYALLPVWVGILLLLRWRKTGKDPKGRGTIVAQYEPPGQLTPGAVGTLVDERADLKDISATIVDLAVRGYLTIEELKSKFSRYSKNFKFILKKPDYESDPALLPFEALLLDHLFGSKKEVKLSELRNKFYQYIKPIQDKMYDEVMRHKYFDDHPEKRRAKYRGWAGILVGIGFFGIFWYGLGIPVLLTGIVVGIFGRAAPRRTDKGVAATEYARGFKLYLYTAERYVVKAMTAQTFERFLPYAMVFDVERQWAAKFKNIYQDEQPTWYHGATPGQTFSAFALTDALRNLSTTTTGTLASRPSSSGSSASGSSGFSGGFSGGGGGGGGSRAG